MKKDLIIFSVLFVILYSYITWRANKKKYFDTLDNFQYDISKLNEIDSKIYQSWVVYGNEQKQAGKDATKDIIKMMQDKADEAKKQSQVISSVFALVGTAAAFIPVVGPFIGPAMTIGGQIYNKYNTANQLSAPSDTVNTIIGATSIAKKSGLIGWLTS